MAENTRITAGIDIGSTTSKAVILKGDGIAACYIGQSTVTPKKTAEIVFAEALSRAGLDREQVSLSSAQVRQGEGRFCR